MWPCQWVRGRELGGLPRESCAVCQQRALGFNGNLRVRDKGFGATVWFGGGWSSGERWRGSEEVLLWVIKLCLLMLSNGCMLWKIQSFSYIKVTTILLFPWLKKFRWQVKGDVYLKEYLYQSWPDHGSLHLHCSWPIMALNLILCPGADKQLKWKAWPKEKKGLYFGIQMQNYERWSSFPLSPCSILSALKQNGWLRLQQPSWTIKIKAENIENPTDLRFQLTELNTSYWTTDLMPLTPALGFFYSVRRSKFPIV